MSREIGIVIPIPGGGFRHPNHAVAAVLGLSPAKHRDGVKIAGCGMDMGFHIVYELGHRLWPNGVPCQGREVCQSNDHRNAHTLGRDDVYGPDVMHNDSGYALRHEWL